MTGVLFKCNRVLSKDIFELLLGGIHIDVLLPSAYSLDVWYGRVFLPFKQGIDFLEGLALRLNPVIPLPNPMY
jgi:hypothetical protein